MVLVYCKGNAKLGMVYRPQEELGILYIYLPPLFYQLLIINY
jgi:hypothetical protein